MARIQSIDRGLQRNSAAEDRTSLIVELPDRHVTRDNLGRLLRRVLDLFNQEFVGRMQGLGYQDIRPRHATVFAHLDPHGTRASDLATRAGMTRQSMGEMIAELVKHGYLEQKPDPTDGRAKVVLLTPRGKQHVSDAARVAVQVQETWERRLGVDRSHELRSILEEMASYRVGGRQGRLVPAND